MFGQVNHATIPRDLHVQRQAAFKAMLPVQRKAKEVEIEFLGLPLIEDSKDRCRFCEIHTFDMAINGSRNLFQFCKLRVILARVQLHVNALLTAASSRHTEGR